MTNMRIVFGTALLLTVPATVLGQRPGLLNMLYIAAMSFPHVTNELGISDKEKEQFRSLAHQAREHHQDWMFAMLDELKASDYSTVVTQHAERIASANKEITENVEDILSSRVTRFNELMTQCYFRIGAFPEVAALNNRPLSARKVNRIVELHRQIRGERNERLAEQEWEVLASPLIEIIGKPIVDLSAGQLVRANLSRDDLDSRFPMVRGLFDITPLRVVSNSKLRAELGLKVGQAARISKIRKEIHLDERVKNIVNSMASTQDLKAIDQTEAMATISELNDMIRREVEDVLEKHQVQRFEQLLFQQYVRDLDCERAMTLIDAESRHLDTVREASRFTKLKLRYLYQMDDLRSGMIAFDAVVGRGAAGRLTGKIALAYEDFLADGSLDDLHKNESLRARRLIAGMAELKARSNPRRRNRQ